jgi:hypothetical protein
MSNYTIQISWSGKDALPDSDPAKVISGDDFQTEFEAVRTAINSKAETVDILSSVYPVGSIYMNATNSTNPASILGFGTWTAFGAGRVPVGFDASNSNFNAAEKTGGSSDAIVVSHTHTATSSVTDPGHKHQIQATANGSGTGGTGPFVEGSYNRDTTTATTGITVGTTVNSTGSSGTNANLQPYITVYMWKRTA